jgi:hypothetical protein
MLSHFVIVNLPFGLRLQRDFTCLGGFPSDVSKRSVVWFANISSDRSRKFMIDGCFGSMRELRLIRYSSNRLGCP